MEIRLKQAQDLIFNKNKQIEQLVRENNNLQSQLIQTEEKINNLDHSLLKLSN